MFGLRLIRTPLYQRFTPLHTSSSFYYCRVNDSFCGRFDTMYSSEISDRWCGSQTTHAIALFQWTVRVHISCYQPGCLKNTKKKNRCNACWSVGPEWSLRSALQHPNKWEPGIPETQRGPFPLSPLNSVSLPLSTVFRFDLSFCSLLPSLTTVFFPPLPDCVLFFLSLYCVQLSLSLSLSCVLLWACLSRSLSLYTNPNRTLCMAALKAFPLVLLFFFLPTMPHVISGTPSLRNG